MLRCAIKLKCPRMLSDVIVLLHDNARLHSANLVRDKLQRFGWETLQHPPYSPDQSPCDFHIFWRPEETFVDVGFIRTRKCKVGEVVDPSATYLFVQDWN